MSRQLLLSVHDVMPRRLGRVEEIVAELQRSRLIPVTLLVVPDTGWDAPSLDRLRALVTAGAVLAGHGWRHVAGNIRGLGHRLHSLLISRDVAEHLALDRDGIVSLIARCHAWFRERALPPPELYVPPAWAMGDARRDDLAALPFRYYETMGGILDAASGSFRRTAMVGFEADTAFRAVCCRAWNAANLAAAGERRPLRVAIHPGDFELRLAADLRRLLDEGGRALTYGDVVASTSSPPR